MIKSFITKTRWLVTIILLTTLSVGQMWGIVTSTFTMKNTGQSSPVTDNSVRYSWTSSNIITGTNNGSGFKANSNMTITIPTGAVLYQIKKSNGNTWGGGATIYVYTGSDNTGTNIASIVTGTNSYTISSNNTGTTYYFENSTAKNAWINTLQILYYPQTVVTLDKNGGDAAGQAKCSYGATACSSFTAATRAGYTCTGYYTATSSGTKVLNADGSRASSSISGWWSSNKWCKDAASATLYAQWESAASCDADPTVGAASLNGSFL